MRHDWLDWVALLLAIALVIFQIFIPPVIGLADDGDFVKITGKFDLYLPQGQKNGFADTTYAIDSTHHWDSGMYSSEVLLAEIAVGLNRIFSSGHFDLRWMGAVHGALYLAAFFLALPLLHGFPLWRRAVLLAGIIVILGDVNYVSSLNSFYMDTAAWVFTCLTAVLYLRCLKWKTTANRAGLLLCLALWITAKTQHTPAACLALVLILVTWRPIRLNGPWLTAAVATGTTALAILYVGTPWDYAPIPCFNVIFYGLLPHSDNVHRDLAQLGLDDSYARWVGTHSYSEGGGMNDLNFVRSFSERTGHLKVALYCVRHPAQGWRLLKEAMDAAGRQRAHLGNYDRLTGAREFQESNAFSAWSSLKKAAFHNHGRLYLGYTLMLVVALCTLAFRKRRLFAPEVAIAVVAFVAMLTVEMLIFSLGDVLDTIRHSFVFNGMTDLAVVFLLSGFLSLFPQDRIGIGHIGQR